MTEPEPIPAATTPMATPKARQRAGVAAVIALLLMPVLSSCGGYDATSKSTEELIATVKDASAGNPSHADDGGGWDSGARCLAAEELGKRKATSAVDVLMAALGDGRVDNCAAEALGAIGDARAVGPLLEAYGEGAIDEQADLATYCGYFDPKLCLELSAVVAALVGIGPAGVDQLISVADAADWVAQDEACGGFRQLEDVIACRELAKLDAAMTALGRLGDRRAETVFVEKLSNNPGTNLSFMTLGAASLYSLYESDKGTVDAAWLPATALAMMYRDEVDHLLPLLRARETVDIAYGIIGLGQADTEQALIDGLMQSGDAQLALFYLRSGNDRLEAAGRDWAAANGYMVTSYPGGSGTDTWGALPDAP